MGIYDRDYTRADRGGERAWVRLVQERSWVTVVIGLNAAVFVLWQVLPEYSSLMQEHFTVSADGVLNHYRFHTLLSSSISHSYFGHILLNLLVLWFFSKDVEERYGPLDFLVLYFFAGLSASLAHVAFNLLHLSDLPALGASGSVMGIVVVCACLNPNRQVLFMGAIPIQLKWLALGYVLSDVLGVFNLKPQGIAYAGHLGGALAGFVFFKLDRRPVPTDRGRSPGWWARIGRWFRRRPRLRVVERRPPEAYLDRDVPVESAAAQKVDAQTSERVDELLKKISAEGLGALSNEEREFLKASSEKYRR